MKRIILITVLLTILNAINDKVKGQETNSSNQDTLYILWTSGDPDVALKMVLMYANAAKESNWFNEVELIIWGTSSKLTSENEEIQVTLKKMLVNGVKIKACQACADQYGVTNKLKSLGFEVEFMGEPLTKILKSNKKLITF